MQPVISAKQMREIDRLTVENSETTSLQLMQAASNACFRALSSHFSGDLAGKKAQILCGQGNNGGDGAALAQELSHVGTQVDVILFGSVAAARGDARTNFEIVCRRASVEVEPGEPSGKHRSLFSFGECDSVASWEELTQQRNHYDIIVDALLGTGLSRPLEGVFVQVVKYLGNIRQARENSLPVGPLILSIDVPSGLSADSAKPSGPIVQADLTVTFTAPKPANVLPPASHANGKLVVADIGSPKALVDAAGSSLFVIEESDARAWLTATRYTSDSYKNTHGRVLLIAGSRGYTGAAVLCGNAAMRSGAGLVTVATPASSQSAMAGTLMPEVMTTALAETDRGAVSDDAVEHVLQLASQATVIALGPGLSAADERTRRFVYSVVKQRKTPVVIDADGLNCLAPWPPDLRGSDQLPLILTPHPGEMLRLLGTTDRAALDDRVAVAREFATSHNLILVLKGSRSLIAAPDGRVFINPTGNAGLGTAGAGDTLTGIIAGFIAQSGGGLFNEADALFAVLAAVYVGGLAGDLAARNRGMRTMVASDIREHLGQAICFLDPAGERP